MYRPPSESRDEFDQFLLNFEQLISGKMSENPHFMLINGDFNVRSSSWWKNNLRTREGGQFDAIISSHGLSQLIH